MKKSYCNKIKTNCFGSAHCDFYEEKQRFASTGIDDDSVLDPITDIVDGEREAEQTAATWNSIIPVGSMIYHKSFKLGQVVENDNDSITVRFGDAETRRFKIADCVKNRRIYRYNDDGMVLLQESDVEP